MMRRVIPIFALLGLLCFLASTTHAQNKKISELTTITGANMAAGDLFVVVDISEPIAANRTKNITRDELAIGLLTAAPGITLGTEIATTSGTAHDFTGLPAGIKRIAITFEGVSLSSSNNIIIQLGDAGGFETTGYISSSVLLVNAGSVSVSSNTTGFIINRNNASNVFSGHMILTLSDSANNTWIASHTGKNATNTIGSGGGDKSLSAELTQVRITRSGTDTFDAGAINIQHQK